MKILHLIGGGDVGGAKTHIISLASRLGAHCTVLLVSFRDGDFVTDARAAGINVVVVENHSFTRDRKQLISIVKEYQPDIIHCHGARANMMGIMLKGKFHLPTVSTIHSDYRLDYMNTLRKQLTFGMINRYCLRRIDYFTCVAKRTSRMMASRGFRAANIFTIYNGIDFSNVVRLTDRREYLQRYGIEYHDGDVYCGIAARLTAVKDVATLIRACAYAVKNCPNLKLVIGGDGEDMESLKSLTEELGIKDNVYFLGWITDVHEFFGAIDINVICSLSETFPYSILEGIQERCATVTSDVGGMPELIDHGVNGFIFPPRDHEALGECLTRLASDENLRNEFSQKLFEKASANFSLDKMASTQYEIYQSILARKRSYKRDGVLICGAYGKGNAGDDAILHAIVNEMHSIDPAMPVCVMSCHPKRTAVDYGVDTIYTFNIPAMRRRMRRCAVYINGGGNLIQDVTSNRSLYFYLYTLRAARKFGAGVMMYGCGIGPVKNSRNLKITAKTINNCVDCITIRENGSAEQLKTLGITVPEVRLSADPAFTLSKAADNQIDRLMFAAEIPPQGDYFCLCVRNWPGFEEKAQIIAEAADYAYSKYGLSCVLLPIEVPGDLSAADTVSKYMKYTPYKISRRYEAEETIGLIARCRMVLSMRLHALIFASQAAVPIAGIVYDPKVAGFMDYMDQRLYISLENTNSAALHGFIDEMYVMSREKLQSNADRLRILERTNAETVKRLIEEHTK